jgi:hypothetical protein
MKLRIEHLVLAAGLLILAAACQNGGIYYALQNEVPIEDLSLPNAVTIFDVAKIGGDGGDYYAAAGKIWTADDSSVAWNKDVRVQGPTADALCTALVTSPFGSNDTLFGGFLAPESNLGLYESGASPTPAGTTWTEVADPIVKGAQVALLKTADDGVDDWLVVVTARHNAGENFTFGIAGFNGANWYEFDTSVRVSPEDQKPFSDVIWSPTFARWLATGGTKLYMQVSSPPAVDSFSEAYMTGIGSGAVLNGLFDDGTNVYVASEDGSVYYSDTYGTDWTPIAAPEISGVNPPLTRFAGPITVGTDQYLLVGSDGYGYYRLPVTGGTPGALTRCPDSTDDLHTASVRNLVYDDTISPERIFACTSMAGLWRGDPDSDPVDPDIGYAWVQE